ncbi:MAG: T9SS type A sorting domain-containing protein [Bacteroidetes bacterium]|nr:T9SS type A sorting domain-containing protein [Bacteroidota bacterium]
MKPILSCILFFTVLGLNAQNENTKWYFGNHAALDFMTNPPTILNNSAMNQLEGCASIADGAGNLLFYTDGVTVYNQLNAVMANGTGLFGSVTSSQSALIVKQPNSSNLYYIFTTMTQWQSVANVWAEAYYSVVDMSLAAGMGSVTIKNMPLYAGQCTEHLHAAKHANGIDYWIMIHERNTNNFRAYLLSPTGVNTAAVVSSVGNAYAGTGEQGCMKFSPTGQKLGVASGGSFNGTGFAALYDFNKNTGTVSNALTLGQIDLAYGCEFSPDGKKFYCASQYNNIVQWDLSASSDAAVISSSVIIASTSGNGFGSMQLAPNGKIYVANVGTQSISIIHKPNVAGAGCNFSYIGQPVNALNINTNQLAYSTYGLPNMLSSPCFVSFSLLNGSVTCNSAATGSAAVISTTGNLTYLWSNGTTTYNTQQVNNLSAGIWSITVTDTTSCSTHSVFAISELPPPTFTPSISSSNSVICPNDTVVLTANGANSYIWSNGAHTSSISVSPLGTTQYYVSTTDLNGCISNSSVVTINVLPAPILSISGSTIYCSAQIVTLTASGAYNYYWQWGGTHAHASSSSIVLKQNITTQYTITGTNKIGCKSTEVVTVTIGCVGSDELGVMNDELRVYPNPTSEMLNVENPLTSKGGTVEIYVYDILGNTVISSAELTFHNSTFNIHHSIDVRELKSGMYFIKIGNRTQKFVKE